MSRTEVEPNVPENKQERPVIICPGFHPPALTDCFVQSVFSQSIFGQSVLNLDPSNANQKVSSLELSVQFCPLVVDAFCANPAAVFDWMTQTLGSPNQKADPILAIGFSGGVVGMAGALAFWRQQGGQVANFLAIDGWGMPIVGLPVCRLSHDEFTHWSTLPLGAGKVNFYADPSVEHLQMWGNPNQVSGQVREGWQTQKGQQMTVTEFVRQVLKMSVKGNGYLDFS